MADAVFQHSVAIRCIVVTEVYAAAGVDGVRDAVVAALTNSGLTLDRSDHNFVGVCVLALLESYGYDKLLDDRGRPVSARALPPFTRGQVYRRRAGARCVLDELDRPANAGRAAMHSDVERGDGHSTSGVTAL